MAEQQREKLLSLLEDVERIKRDLAALGAPQSGTYWEINYALDITSIALTRLGSELGLAIGDTAPKPFQGRQPR